MAALRHLIGLALTLFACRDADPPARDPRVSAPPRAVARIGSTVVDADMLAREIAEARGQLKRVGVEAASDELQHVAGDRLTFDLAVRERAQREGVDVDAHELAAAVRAIRAAYPTEGEFQNALAAQRASAAQHRRSVESDLLMQRLVAKHALTPNDGGERRTQLSTRVRVRSIFIAPGEHAVRRARRVAAKVRAAPAEFARLKETLSDPLPARLAGDEGIEIALAALEPPVQVALRDLPVGHTTGVIETPLGFRIVKLEARFDARIAEDVQRALLATRTRATELEGSIRSEIHWLEEQAR
jgi:parvulin-like peptidyl-prolyl isomerase